MDDDLLVVDRERKLSGVRKIIAERLSASWREAVHVTLHRKMDVSALYEHKHMRVYSFIDYVYYALVLTLGDPQWRKLNAHLEERTHRMYQTVNLGIAVDHPRGLIVPNVHRAETMDLADFASQRKKIVRAAQAWEHSPEMLEAGTFTVSNLGAESIGYFTPILNPPQVAILGLGSVEFVYTSHSWGEPPAMKAMLPLSLSFDHRVIDGAEAARFLKVLEVRTQQWNKM